MCVWFRILVLLPCKDLRRRMEQKHSVVKQELEIEINPKSTKESILNENMMKNKNTTGSNKMKSSDQS